MTVINLYAQDKHNYATPLGRSVFHKEEMRIEWF